VAARERLHRRFVAEEVLAGLRHTIVNKLAGLGALTYHLKRQLPEREQAAAAVLPLLDNQVAEATSALQLRCLEPAPHHPAPVPLATALTETMRTFGCRPPGVELLGPAHDPATALIDADELDLAVFCLMENACEALVSPGGLVRLRCQDLAGEDDVVAVEVADDGPGLAEADRRRASEPFFTTKAGRLGLGLNVAGRVALRARGRLELAPADGRGLAARLVLRRGPR
jgi:C4-dicarboxylate-specific signal transduction histidine kinase